MENVHTMRYKMYITANLCFRASGVKLSKMAVNAVVLPAEVQEQSAKMANEYEDPKCKQLIFRLVNNLQYEQTGKAIMDSIIMADLAPSKFFELVVSKWDDEDKTLSLFRTKQLTGLTRQIGELRQNGFVGIQDKFVCMGCGGVATEIPEEFTLANVHGWLNPSCPAFLGMEPDQITGMELISWPDLKDPAVKLKLKNLQTSTFHMYDVEYSSKDKRRETWDQYEESLLNMVTGKEKDELAEAGWYVSLHLATCMVRCFCCGVEARHMKKDQCPMLTHLLVSPACPYMHAIMEEDDIRAIFAGHKEEVCRQHESSPATNQFFRKIWFQPHIVSYEREDWDKRSTYMQKQSDKEKMRLVAEWLIKQRTGGIDESSPAKKRKIAVSRQTLMSRYQWATRTVDINTRAAKISQGVNNHFTYTPNWKRKERCQRKWGTGTNCNRNAGLVEGDWLILQQ